MKQPSDTTFKLERNKINEIIAKEGEYIEDDVLIKKWGGNNASNNYIAEISKEETSFIGVLNNNFEKDGYGFYRFQNGDHYFGNFKEDQRNNNGFYIWAKEEAGEKSHTESYHGYWRDNLKYKNGIYMWLEEEEDNEEFDNANFDAYVGMFEGNNYKRGTFLQKKGDKYYVYHGDFTDDGKRNDDNAFFYSSSLDRLFHGKIENDVFISGYISYFDEEGIISNIVYCEFESDKSVKYLVEKEDINEEDLKREEEENNLFRNVILEVDYFGKIYKSYKETIRFIIEEMREISIFEDEEKFPKIMTTAVEYTKQNIFLDIEAKVFGKKV